jgi:ParB family chromosome partitioning protein
LKLPKTKAISNLSLTGYNELFASTVNSASAEAAANHNNDYNGERIIEIPLAELHPPEFHPFQVNDDDAMDRLAQNIKQYGVREPGLARPRAGGGYELLAGNRRKRACEIAGLPALPVIVREMSDADATIAMVDSNLEQRETLLFSEKAWAYKVKMEALNHNGVKADKHSYEVLMEQTGESKNQIFRLIRLTELVIGLLDKVDNKQLAFSQAVELSYLSQVEQTAVISAMEKHGVKPSLSQAVRLKKLKQSGELTVEMIDEILSETKKTPSKNDGDMETSRFHHYFPKGYTARQIDEVINSLLLEWQVREGLPA